MWSLELKYKEKRSPFYGKHSSKTSFIETSHSLRLVFTRDGVVVGVVIRRVGRYDLVKIKPTESEAEH